MVNVCRTIVICGEDTAGVKPPAVVVSRNCNTQRAILELVLDSIDVVLVARVVNPAVIASLRGDPLITALLSAVIVLGLVRVVHI